MDPGYVNNADGAAAASGAPDVSDLRSVYVPPSIQVIVRPTGTVQQPSAHALQNENGEPITTESGTLILVEVV